MRSRLTEDAAINTFVFLLMRLLNTLKTKALILFANTISYKDSDNCLV